MEGEPQICEICGIADADMEMVGECDSFGYETLFVCKECFENMPDVREREHQEYLKEHTEIAPEGYLWVGTGVANDDYDSWFKMNQNRAEVEWDQQETDSRWGGHGGLYGASIRLVPDTNALAMAESHRRRWENEEEDWYEEEDNFDEYQFEDADDI